MSSPGFALFDSDLGRCGLAWGPRGVLAILLPGSSEAATRARLLRHAPGACEAEPPPFAACVVAALASWRDGCLRDLAGVPLDMERLPALDRRVYEAARAIPPGATRSYGELAAAIGEPGAAREVGRALARNPFAVVVPCHRVVAAGGGAGGFSAPGGVATKLRLLAIERAAGAAPLPLFAGRLE